MENFFFLQCLLREELIRFWEIDTVGKYEENVIYQFENEIHFNGTRYVI